MLHTAPPLFTYINFTSALYLPRKNEAH